MHPHRNHSTLTDDELLRAYRESNDNFWLGTLLQRHTVLLLGVAMKYLKDKDAAEDAVQHLFMKAITHLPAGEIQNFKGWLYILLRNHCLQQLRDKVYHAPEEVIQSVAATEADIEALQLKNYTLEQLHEVLPALSPDQHTCITRFYLQKQSYQEITDATGFNFAQVKSHIQNGKRNLKIALLKKLNSHQPR